MTSLASPPRAFSVHDPWAENVCTGTCTAAHAILRCSTERHSGAAFIYTSWRSPNATCARELCNLFSPGTSGNALLTPTAEESWRHWPAPAGSAAAVAMTGRGSTGLLPHGPSLPPPRSTRRGRSQFAAVEGWQWQPGAGCCRLSNIRHQYLLVRRSVIVSAAQNEDQQNRQQQQKRRRPVPVSTTPTLRFAPGSGTSANEATTQHWPLSAAASSSKTSSTSLRVVYSLVIYGGLLGFGVAISQLSGASLPSSIGASPEGLLLGLALALPPLVLSCFFSLDSVASAWEVARGVRDGDDDELREFFLGMSPVQYVTVAVMAAIAEEVFFRGAIQCGLTHTLQVGGNGVSDSTLGMAAITGYLPAMAPFSQLSAALVTAALSGTMLYAISAVPSEPHVIISGSSTRTAGELRASVGEWYRRQQLKTIYSPMFLGLVGLYFGIEMLLVGNLFVPIVSHAAFSTLSIHLGLQRLEKQQKLQQQQQQLLHRQLEE